MSIDLVWIEIQGETSLNFGQEIQYIAIGHYSDDSTQDITDQVDWEVS